MFNSIHSTLKGGRELYFPFFKNRARMIFKLIQNDANVVTLIDSDVFAINLQR